MPTVDLSFSVMGKDAIPADHGYHLYSAISRVLPDLHATNGIGIHPIRGTQIGDRRLALDRRSRLVARTDTDHIAELLPLAGKQLSIGGTSLRVGVPQVRSLIASTTFRSRLVVIKTKQAPRASDLTLEIFTAALRRQLDALEVSSEAIVTIGKRRTLRIKDKEVVGYEVILEGLIADESLDIQEKGLGGRRHMGCGVFVALR